MNENFSAPAEEKAARRVLHTQYLLALYDLVILCASCVPVFYNADFEGFASACHLPYMLVFAFSTFLLRFLLKVYQQVWRYGNIQSYMRLIAADFLALWLCFGLWRALPWSSLSFVRHLSGQCLCLLGSISMRMAYRYAYKCYRLNSPLGRFFNFLLRIASLDMVTLNDVPRKNRTNVAIIGAGSVGVSLSTELNENISSRYAPCCFVDTDPDKIGRQINGLPVLSEQDADALPERFGVHEVIFALPQLDAERKNALYLSYKNLGFTVYVYDYPAMQQGGSGKRQLREFSIEDLLFRSPMDVEDPQSVSYYRDKVVLITGGGGSIGSELCRQVAKMSPRRIVILDVFENGAYDLQQDMKMLYGDSLPLDVEILSVCDKPGLEAVFSRYRPQIVLHAAAHKHVPLMEHNCCEAIENNVFGTWNVVELSRQYGVEHFMLISTDKAVNPTNVMGATKRVCEMLVQAYSTDSSTSFSATRFGNVLGSAGSVIPLFRRQIARGGPVTITDKRIIRYFMTIPEAAQLVLRAGAMAENGELFVLDMGKPVRILDLAENMIRLSGLEPYRDIDIQEIGLRPGEKLYEELLVQSETLTRTASDMIFVERDTVPERSAVDAMLGALRKAVDTQDNEAARAALHRAVPTYRRPEVVNAEAEESAEMRDSVQAG